MLHDGKISVRSRPREHSGGEDAVSRPYALARQCSVAIKQNRSRRDYGRKSPPDTAFQALDRAGHSAISQATAGLSPAALTGGFFDWSVHLALSPGKLADLAQQAIAGAAENLTFAAQSVFDASCDPCKRALPHDDRFRAPDWQAFPFNVYAHNFLSIERWWEAATTHVRGVSQRRGDMANFTARQILDTVAPSNLF